MLISGAAVPPTDTCFDTKRQTKTKTKTKTKTHALKFLILEPHFHKIDTRGILFEKGEINKIISICSWAAGLLLEGKFHFVTILWKELTKIIIFRNFLKDLDIYFTFELSALPFRE